MTTETKAKVRVLECAHHKPNHENHAGTVEPPPSVGGCQHTHVKVGGELCCAVRVEAVPKVGVETYALIKITPSFRHDGRFGHGHYYTAGDGTHYLPDCVVVRWIPADEVELPSPEPAEPEPVVGEIYVDVCGTVQRRCAPEGSLVWSDLHDGAAPDVSDDFMVRPLKHLVVADA